MDLPLIAEFAVQSVTFTTRWAILGSNQWPLACEASALAPELIALVDVRNRVRKCVRNPALPIRSVGQLWHGRCGTPKIARVRGVAVWGVWRGPGWAWLPGAVASNRPGSLQVRCSEGGHDGSDSLCDPRPVTEVRPALPFDGLAAAAAVLALVTTVGYLLVLRSQGGESPVGWFLLALCTGAALAGYGARRGVPHRRGALFGAGAVLLAMGLLAILSIGLPIVLAGVLALAAGARARP